MQIKQKKHTSNIGQGFLHAVITASLSPYQSICTCVLAYTKIILILGHYAIVGRRRQYIAYQVPVHNVYVFFSTMEAAIRVHMAGDKAQQHYMYTLHCQKIISVFSNIVQHKYGPHTF